VTKHPPYPLQRGRIWCEHKNYMYKFKIIKNKKGEFRAQFAFRAEPIFFTENYKSRKNAQNAIDKIIKQAATATIEEIDESVKPAKPAAKKAVAKKAKGATANTYAKKAEVKK
jgi:uncharacterized protein YegP (UPF0339 family)